MLHFFSRWRNSMQYFQPVVEVYFGDIWDIGSTGHFPDIPADVFIRAVYVADYKSGEVRSASLKMEKNSYPFCLNIFSVSLPLSTTEKMLQTFTFSFSR